MAGQITAIEVQKRNPRRASIYIDGEFALGLPLVEAAKLTKGQHISDQEIDALQAVDEAERAHEYALRFLSYRPRSKAEVKRRLVRKGYSESIASGEMQRLVGTGLLDDEAFAEFWISNREQFRPRGQYALRQELRQKGIDDRIIDAMLVEIDDTENAYRAAKRKFSSWLQLEPDMARRKLSGYLRRRGFGYEAVQEVWERMRSEGMEDRLVPEESEDTPEWDQ